MWLNNELNMPQYGARCEYYRFFSRSNVNECDKKNLTEIWELDNVVFALVASGRPVACDIPLMILRCRVTNLLFTRKAKPGVTLGRKATDVGEVE